MKIIDPIHKHITFSNEEKIIIDSVFFQRLKNIQQLGFSKHCFPGATHHRFSHSLGACYLAGEAFKSIFSDTRNLNSKKQEYFYKAIRVAALLHDIGHGPLSHSSEPKMPMVSTLNLDFLPKAKDRKASHEDYSALLISQTEISNLLKKIDLDPSSIISLIHPMAAPSNDFIDNGIDYNPVLRQITHSEVDSDRMDYLARDSYYCGTYYGSVDFTWIIKNFTHYIKEGKAFLSIKKPALYAVEDFLLGHHHMHLVVYFHHKNIIYDNMLDRYFQDEECSFSFPSRLEDYLFFHDGFLQNCLEQDSKKIEWARRIVHNDPLKLVCDLRSYLNQKDNVDSKVREVKNLLKENNIDAIHKRSTAQMAKTFNKRDESSIYILNSLSDQIKTLQESVRIFQSTDQIINIDRFFVDKKISEQAKKILRKIDINL